VFSNSVSWNRISPSIVCRIEHGGFCTHVSACLAQLFHLRSGQLVSLGAMRSTDIFRRENILRVLMEAASTYRQKFGNTATGIQWPQWEASSFRLRRSLSSLTQVTSQLTGMRPNHSSSWTSYHPLNSSVEKSVSGRKLRLTDGRFWPKAAPSVTSYQSKSRHINGIH